MKILSGRAIRRGAPLGAIALIWGAALWSTPGFGRDDGPGPGGLTVVAYNDLGMHCMNQDFSEICILPPANTLNATVIARGEDPEILKGGAVVRYGIAGNTRSDNKTNFWKYAQALFGVALPINVGLTGNGLRGVMKPDGKGEWIASAIPITPMTDKQIINAYQLAQVSVTAGTQVANTQTVIPVSWEISCNMCHSGKGTSVATDILRKHDKRFNTKLEGQKPVLCAKCHSDNALGLPGVPGVSSMSTAMHKGHASRMETVNIANKCYACHPGVQTQCLRDVHEKKGMDCVSCHGTMTAVANPYRKPWIDEPRCGSCHKVPGHEYEQPGVLFRNAVGHNGVKCYVCHGSPHAVLPSRNPADNLQSIRLQGVAASLQKCSVCHTKTPEGKFNHTADDD